MNHPDRRLLPATPARALPGRRSAAAAVAAGLLALATGAHALDLAQVPLFLSPAINPNVLVLLDNSQSMDATMGGRGLSGDSAETRSNVARSVLRDILDSYRYSFNWGLGTFEINGTPSRENIFGYYLGTASTMVYTHTCDAIVDGVGVSGITVVPPATVRGVAITAPTNLPCVPNPEPAANGFPFITFERSGDDPDINDVTYFSDPPIPSQMYGIPPTGTGTSDTSYLGFGKRRFGTEWASNFFLDNLNTLTFLATDSGWVASAVDYPRRLWTLRGWGYNNDIKGWGVIVETVRNSQVNSVTEAVAEAAHFGRLKQLLAPEDANPNSTSIKNAARYTPLAGTLETSRNYFQRPASSPIAASCQRNFVVLATDGNPTGKKDGSQYSPTDWVNTYDAGTGMWTYGPAIVDVLNEITALRSTVKDGQTYDIQTYVIGMGDTFVNQSSVATLDEMARQGGTDKAFLARSADALRRAFETVVSDIRAKTSSAAAVGVNSGSWQTGAALYQGTFSSVDWSGNLMAFAVGSDGRLATTPTWEAAARLNAQDWDGGRAIVTYKPSATLGARGIALRWPADPTAPAATELDPAQVLALNKDAGGTADGFGLRRLRYLRGDASNEARNCGGACPVQFRNRPVTVLGDIIDSAPLYLGAPTANYYDDFETVAYGSFAANWRARTPYLYVGANDGMLHAFDATTGDEKFAYVPNLVFDSLSALTAIPFTHRYNVDGSPVAADVFYAGAWHTLLVSGLRGGGRGLYALDVTDPARFSEADAASVVRWEFVDADMGHVFTPPMVVKTNNGRWSVIAGNGYNNVGSGRAVLYVIDAETGEVVRKIDAGTAIGNGLSGPAAVDVNSDGVVDVVYAGDLNGKLWKFDLTAATPADWGVAAGGAALFDAGSGKPITTRPDVTRSPKGGYLVTFGTGRYMSWSDPGNTDVQTAYGIWDRDGTVVTADKLQQQLIETVTATAGGDTYRTSTHRVGAPLDAKLPDDEPSISRDTYFATLRGWYVDLPTAGERIVADARIRGGRAIFTSTIPNNADICNYGGSGWVLEFDVFTGNRLDSATFDVDNNGALTDADYLSFGGAGGGTTNTSGWRIGAVPAAPTFMRFRDGNANSEIKYVNTSDGNIVQKREAAGSGGEGRVMWRVVQ